jgi:O-methyltransferase involved in polyketide biosynthesis
LLEGFIGYLKVTDSNVLLSHLQQHSAPGSCIIITAPPRPEDEARSAAKAAAAKPAASAATAAAAQLAEAVAAIDTSAAVAGDGVAADGNTCATSAAVCESSGKGQVEAMKLYHSTFEEPTSTLDRLCAAGWADCRLLTKEQLTAKYGTAHAQPILVGGI